MNAIDAILSRRSIRKYKKGALLSDGDLKTILSCAMHAPSACNMRPWEFYVLKSDNAKEKVLKIHPSAKHFEDASCAILVCALPEKQSPPATGFYPQDVGATIQNILLSAHALGYGACWCGIYPREDRVKLYKDEFNLASLPVGLVVLGKADEEPTEKGFYDEERVEIL